MSDAPELKGKGLPALKVGGMRVPHPVPHHHEINNNKQQQLQSGNAEEETMLHGEAKEDTAVQAVKGCLSFLVILSLSLLFFLLSCCFIPRFYFLFCLFSLYFSFLFTFLFLSLFPLALT